MKQCSKQLIIYRITFLIILVLAYLPFLQKGLFSCWDDTYHLYRIYSIADAMKNGIFPVKIHFIECYGYGYGTGLFYPNLLFYFPALLVMCGMSLTLAYKIFVAVLMAAIWGTTYYSSYRLSQNPDAAFIAATIVLLSNKMLNAFYLGMSLGIITGAVFMPLAIAGMVLLLAKDESPHMLIIGFTGLLYSHTISTFLSVCICGIICLFYLKKLIKYLPVLIFSVGIVCLLTAPYWLTMLEQMHSQTFKVSAPWTTSEQNIEYLRTLTTENGIGTMVLIVLCICLISITILLIRHKLTILENCLKPTLLFLLVGIVLLILPLYYPFWHFMNSFVGIKILQFPYRLWGVATLLFAFTFACIYPAIMLHVHHNILLRNLILVGIVLSAFINAHQNFSSNYLQTNSTAVNDIIQGKVAGLGGGEEWLPIMTTRDDMTEPETARDDAGNEIKGEKLNGCSQFVFTPNSSSTYYDIPYIYYKGYRAVTADGFRLSIVQNPDTGMIRIYMPDSHGEENPVEITVSYHMTKYQVLSYIMLFIGLIIYGAYIMRRRFRL